ncbi:MAG: hypothetical protein JW384_01962 [Nitrosomonadaceae bacterium]|nr:hypothetical protein [Nitrosomonadaceae bacterium]
MSEDDIPLDAHIVDWLVDFKVKRDSSGLAVRYKARVCAKGFTQREGIDYGETYAPVVDIALTRALLAHAAKEGHNLRHIDFKQAFLNAPLDRPIYMRMIPGIPNAKPGDILLLKRGLYGLKQSPNLWGEHLSATLNTIKFESNSLAERAYVNNDSKQLAVVHVDDLLLSSSTDEQANGVITKLGQTYRISDLGPVKRYLGMNVERLDDGSYTLDQSDYIDKALQRFGMSDCNSTTTPMVPGSHLAATTAEDVKIDTREYLEFVGTVNYLATCTRPDISATVRQLAEHNSDPSEKHWHAAKHLLRYLKGTRTAKLVYQAKHGGTLLAYADAEYAGAQQSRRSAGGYVIFLNDSPIAWSSKTQKRVTLSTTEAEFRALTATAREIIYLRQVLSFLGIIPPNEEATVIYEDNAAVESIAKSGKVTDGMRHAQVHQRWVYEQQKLDHTINVTHVSSADNIADLFTKALPVATLDRHADKLLTFQRTPTLSSAKSKSHSQFHLTSKTTLGQNSHKLVLEKSLESIKSLDAPT